MNLATLEPEECHRLAQEHIAKGDFVVAAQLLQVAILKAPREPAYKTALEELRNSRLEKVREDDRAARHRARAEVHTATDAELAGAEVSALRDIVARFPGEVEHVLRLACHLDTAGETQEALTWARKAVEMAEDSLDAHLLVMALHKKLGNRTAAERARRDVRLVSGGDLATVRMARGRLKQMGLQEAALLPLVPPVGQRRRAVLLAALLVVTAGGWWVGRPPPPVPLDPQPWLALVDVGSALLATEKGELTLALNPAAWDGVPLKDRRERMLGLFKVTEDQGYQRLVLRDAEGGLVGIAEPGKVYLRMKGVPGMEYLQDPAGEVDGNAAPASDAQAAAVAPSALTAAPGAPSVAPSGAPIPGAFASAPSAPAPAAPAPGAP